MRIWLSLLSTLPPLSIHAVAAERGDCTDPSKSFHGGALLQRKHALIEPPGGGPKTSKSDRFSHEVAEVANGSPKTHEPSKQRPRRGPVEDELLKVHRPNAMPLDELLKVHPGRRGFLLKAALSMHERAARIPESQSAKRPPALQQTKELAAQVKIPVTIASDQQTQQAAQGDIKPGNWTNKRGSAGEPPRAEYAEVSRKDGRLKKRRGIIKKKASKGGRYKDTSTLIYHFHMPRTGGTTTANLIMAHICDPFLPEPQTLKWEEACTQFCNEGLTDNEFVCNPGRREHDILAPSLVRAQALTLQSGATQTVVVTTLRRGSDRLLSEWLFSMNYWSWWPQTTPDKVSNESLLEYLAFIDNPYNRWPGANLQVAYLASVPVELYYEHEINDGDFELAKQALLAGEWLIGFSDCLDQLNEKLYEVSTMLHTIPGVPRVVPHISQGRAGGGLYEVSEGDESAGVSKSKSIDISPEVRELVDYASRFDNALFDWAWQQAEAGVDARFTKTCQSTK